MREAVQRLTSDTADNMQTNIEPPAMPTEANDSRTANDKAVVCKELLGCVVVAFMQNMWVKDPAKVKASIERMHWMKRDEYRLRLIHYSLFAGCMSGRRLKAAFGDMTDEIIWEEASPEIADNPKTICLPVPRHIQCALEYHNPDIVITFGKLAGDAVAKLWPAKIIRVCHPAARQPDTIQKLKAAADELRTFAKHPNAELSESAREKQKP